MSDNPEDTNIPETEEDILLDGEDNSGAALSKVVDDQLTTDIVRNEFIAHYLSTTNQPFTGQKADTFYAQLQKLLSPQAMANDESRVTADGAEILASTRYPTVAYSDKLSSMVPENPEQEVRLPGGRLVRYADDSLDTPSGARLENDDPAFILDARVFIQGIDVSEYLTSEIRYTSNNTAGYNEASFTLTNPDDRFVWTERNLASIYGRSAIRARAPYVQQFTRQNREAIEERIRIARGNTVLSTIDISDTELADIEANYEETAVYNELVAKAFTTKEHIKSDMFRYKADPSRNPPIRSPKNSISHARFDLVPNKPIFNRMDPIRIFVLYPFRVPGKEHEQGQRLELWMPAFTGYVGVSSIDDDYLNGQSRVTVTCQGIKHAVLQRMKTSNDLTSGLANPLDALGFRTAPGYATGRVPQDVAITDEVKENTEGFYDINNTLFYDDIIVNEFNQPFPNMPIEQAVREVLVAKEPITAESNNRGVRGIEFGGNFYYDSDFTREEARNFLESWHKFCLFGPKRRPWTREEMEEVGAGTTTDGDYAPNKIRLWFLLPKSGTGPGNLADLSQVSVQLSHDVNWTNRLEIITNFVEALDYNWMVTPCGDMICEFNFADFKPEDFGEFGQTFRIEKATIAGQQAAEQEVPPSGMIVTTGFAVGATLENEVAQASLTKTFVYSPYIAARYGISHDTESLPFLTARDKAVAQQRAVMLYQRRLARAHAMNLQFIYRPFNLPNRPNNHVRRTMIGSVVSNETTLMLGDQPKAESQVGYEHVRYFTGFYRTADDLENLNTFQQNDLQEFGGVDPNNLQQLLGLDPATDINPEEMRIYSTVAAGESLPTSNRYGWSSDSVIAAASGIYVLDVDKVREKQYGTPVVNTAEDPPSDNDTVIEDPPPEEAVREEETFKFARGPLRNMRVTSPFGPRRHPVTGVPDQHEGLDFAAAIGDDVLAVDSGTIIKAGKQVAPSTPYSGKDSVPGTGGNILLMRTDSGFLVQMLHLDASGRGLVSFGQRVQAGEVIAKAGSTGRGTGPHLHFEVIPRADAVKAGRSETSGKKVDPAPYIPGLS